MYGNSGVEPAPVENDGEAEVEEDELDVLESERLNIVARDLSSKPLLGVVVIALPVSLDGMSILFLSR